MNVQRLNVID